MEPQTYKVLLRTSESCLANKTKWGVLCRQEPLALDFFMLGSHLYTFTSQDFILNRPNESSSSPLCHQVVAYYCQNTSSQQALPRLLAGVVTERDAWSLWSMSQQQTVHTSRQCLGIVAHFRTSVHDTVSVVTLSSLVPHQRLTSCTFVSVHTCVQVPKLNIHTRKHPFTHFSILSPVEALHMKL